MKSKSTEFRISRLDETSVRATARWSPHTAHWKVFDKGYAFCEIDLYRKKGSISFDTNEVTEHGKSSKRTMVTFDYDQASALRDFLNEYLPPQVS